MAGRHRDMKDYIIKGTWIKQEVYILMGCVIFASLVNAYAILKFGTSWVEIITSLHYVAAMAGAVYLLIWVPRLLIKLLVILVNRLKSGTSS